MSEVTLIHIYANLNHRKWMDQNVCAGRRLCGSDDVASLTKSGPRAIVWRLCFRALD